MITNTYNVDLLYGVRAIGEVLGLTEKASRPDPSAIWWRQLVPSATISVSASASRTAGRSVSSAIFIETS